MDTDYKKYPPTKSCYLDGRYFNKVFKNYPGLITRPLNITVVPNGDKLEYTNHMKQVIFNQNYPGLLRVIINSPKSRHSNLLILDYNNNKIYRYDPNGTSSPYYNKINQIIKKYLGMYFDFEIVDVNVPVIDPGNQVCSDKGIKNGFCVAYVIKFAQDWLSQKQYDPSHILSFANFIETTYGPLDNNKPDIEYGLFGSSSQDNNGRLNPQGALIGGVAGLGIGGLLGGGTGAIAGGIGGAFLGGML